MALASPSTRVGFWPRVAATVLDAVLLLPLLLLYGVGLTYLDNAGRLTHTMQYLADVSISLLAVAYSGLEVLAAGTPGKRILKLRIADRSGQPADPWKLALRWSTKNMPAIVALAAAVTTLTRLESFTGFLGLLIVIGFLPTLGEDRLAWHDRWAGTAVYRRRDPEDARGFEPVALPAPDPAAPAAAETSYALPRP